VHNQTSTLASPVQRHKYYSTGPPSADTMLLIAFQTHLAQLSMQQPHPSCCQERFKQHRQSQQHHPQAATDAAPHLHPVRRHPHRQSGSASIAHKSPGVLYNYAHASAKQPPSARAHTLKSPAFTRSPHTIPPPGSAAVSWCALCICASCHFCLTAALSIGAHTHTQTFPMQCTVPQTPTNTTHEASYPLEQYKTQGCMPQQRCSAQCLIPQQKCMIIPCNTNGPSALPELPLLHAHSSALLQQAI
jgi:hypothetical protein